MSACVLIAGGGTGGHLFPGVAVAQALRTLRPDITTVFVGAGRALEGRALADAGFKAEKLKSRALRGAGLWGRLKALAVLPGAVLRARGLIKRYRPALVLAVGGYAAFPLGVAAWLSRVPLAVQEQNALPGLTNRMLARLARRVFVAFEECLDHLPRSKSVLAGNPVRPDLLGQAEVAAAQRSDDGRPFTVLVIGGSQGAHSLNQALVEAMERLAGRTGELAFIHQTGPKDEAWVAGAYAASGLDAEVAAFFPDVGRAYGAAHLVFCRAGAGTLTEALAVGRAVVAVPYPHAAGDHQTHNARALVASGAAELIADAEVNGQRAAAVIEELMDDPVRRRAMEKAARSLARPQAAQDIAGQCLDLMKEAS